MLLQLDGGRSHQPVHPRGGRGVAHLAEVALEPGDRGREHDAPTVGLAALLLRDHRRAAARRTRSVPARWTLTSARNVSASVESRLLSWTMPALATSTSSRRALDRERDGRLGPRLGVGRRGRGDRLPACGHDLLYDRLRDGWVSARAVPLDARVVDHDARALASEEQRVSATDAAPSARDEGDLAVEEAHRQCTRIPGLAPESGVSKNASPSAPAARTMPSDRPSFICRGARFAQTMMSRPTRSSGL